MRKFVPLADRVLVKPDGAEQAKVPTRGLATPQAQKEEPTEGVVVAVGQDANARNFAENFVWTERSVKLSMSQSSPEMKGTPTRGVSIGQRVQWAKYSGREVLHNGEKHRLLRLEEIDGVIVDE